MPNDYTTLGFRCSGEEDLQDLLTRVLTEGERLSSPNGLFLHYPIGEGIELWAAVNRDNELLGLNPHFASETRMRVGLTKRLLPYGPVNVMEGRFFAWVDWREDSPETGEHPIIFEVPDFDRFNEWELPCGADVQIAAFAQELRAFADKDEFHAKMPLVCEDPKMRFSPKFFLPVGQYQTEDGAEPEPTALFAGQVIEARLVTNPAAGGRFWWVQTQISGGTVDVVADPEIVEGQITEGGTIVGAFWLSGRLDTLAPPRRSGF